MAIIDTLRFRNILVDGEIAEEAAAQELVAALDETFDEQLNGLATQQALLDQGAALRAEMAQTRAELRAEMAQMRAELRAEMRAMEVRLTKMMMYVGFGLFAALAALMTLLQVFVN